MLVSITRLKVQVPETQSHMEDLTRPWRMGRTWVHRERLGREDCGNSVGQSSEGEMGLQISNHS